MKKTALILGLFFSVTSFASIECHTPRMNKTFKIEDNRVTFFNDQIISGREIASIGTRTKTIGNGFTKVLNFEGHKHTIHIDDKNKFSDINDYIIVRNSRGHEMTYPISCK